MLGSPNALRILSDWSNYAMPLVPLKSDPKKRQPSDFKRTLTRTNHASTLVLYFSPPNWEKYFPIVYIPASRLLLGQSEQTSEVLE